MKTKTKIGRPRLGREKRMLLTVSIDPRTAKRIKSLAKKIGSKCQVIDQLINKGKIK